MIKLFMRILATLASIALIAAGLPVALSNPIGGMGLICTGTLCLYGCLK